MVNIPSTTYWNIVYNSSILALRLLSDSKIVNFDNIVFARLLAIVVSYSSVVILGIVNQFDSN